jgi:hypothetical protein
MIRLLTNLIFRVIPLDEPLDAHHREETRHQLTNFLTMAVCAGLAGAFLAFVAWYCAQL